MKHIIKFILLAFIIAQSCVDQYSLDVPFSGPVPFVDFLISTDTTMSYLKIGLTYKSGTDCFLITGTGSNSNCNVSSNGITEMMVTITEEGGRVVYTSTNYNHQAIYGLPGKKYFLDMDLTYNSKTQSYHAETMMMPTPAIDSIGYTIRAGPDQKGDYFVPLIWFRDNPNQRNYYLFNLNGGTNRVWPYSVLSDEFLPANVKGLSIDAGATVAKYNDFYPQPVPGAEVTVKMYSVTYDTYKFYKALIDQFNNDGGAYSPTPSSPPGNINNGAVGLFRAMQETSASIRYQ